MWACTAEQLGRESFGKGQPSDNKWTHFAQLQDKAEPGSRWSAWSPVLCSPAVSWQKHCSLCQTWLSAAALLPNKKTSIYFLKCTSNLYPFIWPGSAGRAACNENGCSPWHTVLSSRNIGVTGLDHIFLHSTSSMTEANSKSCKGKYRKASLKN